MKARPTVLSPLENAAYVDSVAYANEESLLAHFQVSKNAPILILDADVYSVICECIVNLTTVL